jgi:hypothetical protein
LRVGDSGDAGCPGRLAWIEKNAASAFMCQSHINNKNFCCFLCFFGGGERERTPKWDSQPSERSAKTAFAAS